MLPHAVAAQPAPEMLQEIALEGLEFGSGIIVATKFALAPALSEEGPLAENVKRLVTVIAAVAFFDGSAMLVAVRRIAGGDGRICGAVNTPVELTVPQATPEQPAPLAAQFTAVLGCPAEATVA